MDFGDGVISKVVITERVEDSLGVERFSVFSDWSTILVTATRHWRVRATVVATEKGVHHRRVDLDAIVLLRHQILRAKVIYDAIGDHLSNRIQELQFYIELLN